MAQTGYRTKPDHNHTKALELYIHIELLETKSSHNQKSTHTHTHEHSLYLMDIMHNNFKQGVEMYTKFRVIWVTETQRSFDAQHIILLMRKILIWFILKPPCLLNVYYIFRSLSLLIESDVVLCVWFKEIKWEKRERDLVSNRQRRNE